MSLNFPILTTHNAQHTTLLFVSLALFLVLSAPAPAQAPAGGLACVDRHSGQVLFTAEDIVCFDWDRQIFELKRRPAIELLAWMRSGYPYGPNFAFQDAQGIFDFERIIHSPETRPDETPPGDRAMRLEDPLSGPFRAPLFRMRCAGLAPHPDPRLAARLRDGLAAAGLLQPIDRQTTQPLDALSTFWVAGDQKRKAQLTVFRETVRTGEGIVALILLEHMLVVENPGMFRAEATLFLRREDRVLSATAPVAMQPCRTSRLAHLARLDPALWQAFDGRGPVTGPAELTLTLFKSDAGKPIDRWDFPPLPVEILPRTAHPVREVLTRAMHDRNHPIESSAPVARPASNKR